MTDDEVTQALRKGREWAQRFWAEVERKDPDFWEKAAVRSRASRSQVPPPAGSPPPASRPGTTEAARREPRGPIRRLVGMTRRISVDSNPEVVEAAAAALQQVIVDTRETAPEVSRRLARIYAILFHEDEAMRVEDLEAALEQTIEDSKG
jgi:hypothetical protein